MIELRSGILSVGLLTYGARVAYVRAPDRTGVPDDVTIGFDTDAQWRADTTYQGATVGRFAGRIAGGRFELDGTTVELPRNEGSVTLHGGPAGWSLQDWTAGPVEDLAGGQRVTLRRTSPDGEMGFPGTVEVSVTVTVSGGDLVLDHHATTDAPTVLVMTNHTYWNLAGTGAGLRSIGDHRLRFFADRYLPIDEDSVPTGDLVPVPGTPFDFTTDRAIGERWHDPDPQLQLGLGYDHTFVLDGSGGEQPVAALPGTPLRVAARVLEPVSGRTLDVLTDQPGVNFYTANKMNGSVRSRAGLVRQSEAFCLEPQHFPDSPHHDEWPSTVLRPGEEYRNRTVYRFGTDSGTDSGTHGGTDWRRRHPVT
ncbi:aldose epimerase family protein [Nakamurella endophytica]|uniref:Aldose 1-epimerase n=1 Tax=Nakamurella endophytica TaxID=1748367 RepID=A0A917SYQ7_9ACTN|nr:aldose epimerase family protein [Nakamurella endophytica]GGM01636.1 aldose 1-epimerase [Nakamurella endophytica]